MLHLQFTHPNWERENSCVLIIGRKGKKTNGRAPVMIVTFVSNPIYRGPKEKKKINHKKITLIH